MGGESAQGLRLPARPPIRATPLSRLASTGCPGSPTRQPRPRCSRRPAPRLTRSLSLLHHHRPPLSSTLVSASPRISFVALAVLPSASQEATTRLPFSQFYSLTSMTTPGFRSRKREPPRRSPKRHRAARRDPRGRPPQAPRKSGSSSSYNFHEPPAFQRRANFSPFAAAMAGGTRNEAANETTTSSVSAGSVFTDFFQNAFHTA